MNGGDYLFDGPLLSSHLENGLGGAIARVENIDEDQFTASSDEAIFSHVKSLFYLHPLALHEESAEMEKRQANISFDGGRTIVSGTEITVRIPFTGRFWLWNYSTAPAGTSRPKGS